MAIGSVSSSPYINADGLPLKFGTDKAVPTQAGEFRNYGAVREMEVVLTMSQLTTSSLIANDVILFPASTGSGDDLAVAFIEEVETETIVAPTSGGSGTLSVGLYKYDRTTAVSETALINATTFASIDTAGERNRLTSGSAGAGSLIGSNLTVANGPCFISAKVSSAYTAGVVKIRIRYSMVLATAAMSGTTAALNPGT